MVREKTDEFDIICPFCEDKRDAYRTHNEKNGDTFDEVCGNCGKEFSVTFNETVTWTTHCKCS